MNRFECALKAQNCLRNNLAALIRVVESPEVEAENKLEANDLIGNLIDDLFVSQYDFPEED